MNGKEDTQRQRDKLRNYYHNPNDELIRFTTKVFAAGAERYQRRL